MSSNGQIPVAQVNGLGTAATYNVPASGDAAAGEVVLGSDSRLGTGGGGSGALAKISETELLAAAATISFASIPGTYSSLRLVITARSNVAAANDSLRIYFNGDTTAANYKLKMFYGSTGTSYDANTDSRIAYIPGSTATAGEPGTVEVLIPHYAKTTFRKVAQSQFYTPSTPLSGISNVVRLNTAAITDLQLSLASGSFITGTVATLYGMA